MYFKFVLIAEGLGVDGGQGRDSDEHQFLCRSFQPRDAVAASDKEEERRRL